MMQYSLVYSLVGKINHVYNSTWYKDNMGYVVQREIQMQILFCLREQPQYHTLNICLEVWLKNKDTKTKIIFNEKLSNI